VYENPRSPIFVAEKSDVPGGDVDSGQHRRGRRQKSEKEFRRFLGYALNSTSEVEYHLIVAHDTKVISEADFVSLVSQTITVRKMLYGLLKRLSNPAPDVKPQRSVPH
jgi:23S rRNA-intervening sequence protein